MAVGRNAKSAKTFFAIFTIHNSSNFGTTINFLLIIYFLRFIQSHNRYIISIYLQVRNILVKGLSVTNPEVYNGFIVVLLWIAAFFFLCMAGLRRIK